MRRVLVLVCSGLERACCLFHWVPWYGCQLATWSAMLDEAFDLGVWSESGGDYPQM